MKSYRKWAMMCCAVTAFAAMLSACSSDKPDASSSPSAAGTPTSSSDSDAGSTAKPFEKRITFSATSVDLSDDGNYMNDEIYKAFDAKFNFSTSSFRSAGTIGSNATGSGSTPGICPT